MEQLRKLRLVDEHGKPLSARIDDVLAGLLRKFRRRFPSIQDEGDLTEVFEKAAWRIEKRESESGPIENVHSYAWVALRNGALSWLRRPEIRMERKAVRPEARQAILSTLPATDGTPEQIEQDILLAELTAQLTPNEKLVFMLKKAGYSSRYIAGRLGVSVNAVDVLFTRVKQKIRRLAGVRR